MIKFSAVSISRKFFITQIVERNDMVHLDLCCHPREKSHYLCGGFGLVWNIFACPISLEMSCPCFTVVETKQFAALLLACSIF
jgi:hypothetical protein